MGVEHVEAAEGEDWKINELIYGSKDLKSLGTSPGELLGGWRGEKVSVYETQRMQLRQYYETFFK